MKNALLVAILSAVGLSLGQAQTITNWTFEGLSTSGVNASPAATSGSGVASTVGMTFSGNSDNSGIAALAGTDGTNGGGTNLTWKVRGTGGTGGNSNGWSSAAGIASQGAQFSVTTVGETGITTSFDWYPSTTGEANLLIQYTLDGTTWVNAPSADITIPTVGTLSLVTNSGTDANSVVGTYVKTTSGNTWYNGITLNLSSVTGANNDSAFGVRFVNASTGTSTVQATSGGALDNTKGNWSFDDVQVQGTAAVPEPGTYALMLAGFAALLAYQIRRRRSNSIKL